MNLFVLFDDRAITQKKYEGNFASCPARKDAVSPSFFSGDTPSPNKKINSFLEK
jgi:hypothetical protein